MGYIYSNADLSCFVSLLLSLDTAAKPRRCQVVRLLLSVAVYLLSLVVFRVMAGVWCMTCGAVFLFSTFYICEGVVDVNPSFNSIKVINVTFPGGPDNDHCLELLLEVNGQDLDKSMKVRITTNSGSCTEKRNLIDIVNSNFTVIWSNSTTCVLSAKVKSHTNLLLENTNFYTCVQNIHRTNHSETKPKHSSAIEIGLSTFDSNSEVKWLHQGKSGVFHISSKRKHFVNERSADVEIPRSVHLLVFSNLILINRKFTS